MNPHTSPQTHKITNKKIGIIIILTLFFWLCLGIIIYLTTSYILNLDIRVVDNTGVDWDIRDIIRSAINCILGLLFIAHFCATIISGLLWFIKKLKQTSTLKVKLLFFLSILGILLLSILWIIQSYRFSISMCCAIPKF